MTSTSLTLVAAHGAAAHSAAPATGTAALAWLLIARSEEHTSELQSR